MWWLYGEIWLWYTVYMNILWFTCITQMLQSSSRHSPKGKHLAPEKIVVGRRAFPYGVLVTFSGPFAIKLQRGVITACWAPWVWQTKMTWLVVSTRPKNISQIGSFSQVGVKIKKRWKPPSRDNSLFSQETLTIMPEEPDLRNLRLHVCTWRYGNSAWRIHRIYH